MYGWRARIGRISPSPETVGAEEWRRSMPDGVCLVETRTLIHDVTVEGLSETVTQIERAALELASAELDIILQAGNPGLRAGDADAIRKVRVGRAAAHLDGVLEQLESWLPTVRRMRPDQPWGDVVRVLNRGDGATWTVERLRRTVRRLVTEGIVEASLLDRARLQTGDDRLVRLVAGIKAAAPDRTLQQIAAQLETMHERTPRGGTRWHPSSVKHLLSKRTALK